MRRDLIFISYSDKDSETVKNMQGVIKKELDNIGQKPRFFFDKDSQHIGPWKAAIEKNISTAIMGLIFLSKNYAKTWTALRKELRPLYEQQKAGKLILFPLEISKLEENDLLHIEEFWPDVRDMNRYPVNPKNIEGTLKDLAKRIGAIAEILNHSQTEREAECDHTLVERRELQIDIGNWAKRKGARLCIIEGKAGMGKSWFIESISQVLKSHDPKELNGELLASHYCTTETEGLSIYANSLLKNLVSHMLLERPTDSVHILADDLKQLAEANDSDAHGLFLNLLIPILDKILSTHGNGYFYLLIDALDHADQGLVRILSSATRSYGFPARLRIVATTRPGNFIRKELPNDNASTYYVRMTKEVSRSDVRRYIENQLLADNSMDLGADIKKAVKRINRKANGIFLIANYIIEELKSGHLKIDDFDNAPLGTLGEYYEKYFARNISKKNHAATEELLSLLMAAGDRVPSKILERCLGNEDRFEMAKDAIVPLIDQDDVGMHFSHVQLSRWLRGECEDTVTDLGPLVLEKKAGSQKLQIDVGEGHRKLSVACCEQNVVAIVDGRSKLRIDLKGMKNHNAECNTALPVRYNKSGIREIIKYAEKHAPRHFIRAFPPEEPHSLIPCAINFLSHIREKGPEYRQHVRRLTRHFGDVFSGGTSKHKQWIRGISDAKLSEVMSHLENVYETEILVGPMRLMLEATLTKKHRAFPKTLDRILRDDYVMRFGLAMSFALAYRDDAKRRGELGDWMGRLWNARAFHQKEIGAYAICLTTGVSPGFVNDKNTIGLLKKISEAPIYPPRSAYGDLLLNNACQRVHAHTTRHEPLRGTELVTAKNWNWQVWEHTRLDATDLRALERGWNVRIGLNAEGLNEGDVNKAIEELKWAEKEREALLGELKDRSENAIGAPGEGNLRELLENYWCLGARFDLIRTIKERPPAGEIGPRTIRLLFGHPLWWVTEAAASSLASLAENSLSHQKFINRLLDDDSSHWRVQYGAIETAFALRHFKRELFEKAVEKAYRHKIARIRALCAEDLVSQIIEGDGFREGLLEKHKEQLGHWFRDDDCWVLDHPYRLLAAMNDWENEATKKLVVEEIVKGKGSWDNESALLSYRDWESVRNNDHRTGKAMARLNFLHLIEARKRESKSKLA